MNKAGLTPRQKDVLGFLQLYYNEYGIFPSHREISNGKIEGKQVITKVAASSTIKDTLDRIEKRGHIRKNPHMPRGLELL